MEKIVFYTCAKGLFLQSTLKYHIKNVIFTLIYVKTCPSHNRYTHLVLNFNINSFHILTSPQSWHFQILHIWRPFVAYFSMLGPNSCHFINSTTIFESWQVFLILLKNCFNGYLKYYLCYNSFITIFYI